MPNTADAQHESASVNVAGMDHSDQETPWLLAWYVGLGRYVGLGIRIYITLAIGALLWTVLHNPLKRTQLGHWWIVVGVASIFALLALFIPYTRRWYGSLNASERAAFFIFVVIPLMAIALMAAPTWQYRMTVGRVVFLAIVILLPPTMFYLFIATRKVSLLSELIGNLDRLGFLNIEKNIADPEISMARRFESYLRKFEALYGAVSDKEMQQAFYVSMTRNKPPSVMPDRGNAGNVFTSEAAIPVIVASILMALGWILILPPLRLENWSQVLAPTWAAPEYFAFLGAYFFSLQMLFRRYAMRDLRPSAYVSVAMRTILAVIGTWMLGVASYKVLHFDEHAMLLLAFVVGVFPSVAWQFVQSALKKLTFAGFFIPSLKTQLPIDDLDGLTVWHEARLEEEDVENIPNMATADLVDLMLQTRFSPDRIIDWVDQAILYTHIGPEEGKSGESVRLLLRQHGVRTATSLVYTYRRAQESGDGDAFEMILKSDNRSRVRSMVDAVQTNPNFNKIWKWRQLEERGQLHLAGRGHPAGG